MCGYVRISAAAACGSQRCQIPLKLECQAVVGHPAWVPGMNPTSPQDSKPSQPPRKLSSPWMLT